MRRLASSLSIALLLLSVPAFAKSKEEKEALKQCKTEYSAAKKAAGEKATHKERVDAKKDAKKAYEECVDKAKHKS